MRRHFDPGIIEEIRGNLFSFFVFFFFSFQRENLALNVIRNGMQTVGKVQTKAELISISFELFDVFASMLFVMYVCEPRQLEEMRR